MVKLIKIISSPRNNRDTNLPNFTNVNIYIINGPNLNLLGKREPETYGNANMEDSLELWKKKYLSATIHYFQSNVEGEIINKLHEIGFKNESIIINPGGYTHTSVAIADAIAAISAPVLEVHISNVFAREDYRKVGITTSACIGSITGFGMQSYEMAIQYFLNRA